MAGANLRNVQYKELSKKLEHGEENSHGFEESFYSFFYIPTLGTLAHLRHFRHLRLCTSNSNVTKYIIISRTGCYPHLLKGGHLVIELQCAFQDLHGQG